MQDSVINKFSCCEHDYLRNCWYMFYEHECKLVVSLSNLIFATIPFMYRNTITPLLEKRSWQSRVHKTPLLEKRSWQSRVHKRQGFSLWNNANTRIRRISFPIMICGVTLIPSPLYQVVHFYELPGIPGNFFSALCTNCLEFQVISFQHCGMKIDGALDGNTMVFLQVNLPTLTSTLNIHSKELVLHCFTM